MLIAAGEWQPMLDLDPLFDVHSLSTLAATIEYDFQNMFVVVIVAIKNAVFHNKCVCMF